MLYSMKSISVSSLYLTHAWIEHYLFVSRKQKSPPGISSADSSCVLLRVYLCISVQVVRAMQTAQHIWFWVCRHIYGWFTLWNFLRNKNGLILITLISWRDCCVGVMLQQALTVKLSYEYRRTESKERQFTHVSWCFLIVMFYSFIIFIDSILFTLAHHECKAFVNMKYIKKPISR